MYVLNIVIGRLRREKTSARRVQSRKVNQLTGSELLLIIPRTESMKTKNWSTSQSQTAAGCGRCHAQKYYSMIMEFFKFLCRNSFSTDANHTPARVGTTSCENNIKATYLKEYLYFLIILTYEAIYYISIRLRS